MPDRVDEMLESLERVPVPVGWSDVEERAKVRPVAVAPERRPRWPLGVAAAVLVLTLVGTAIVLVDGDDVEPARTGPAPTTEPAPMTTERPQTTEPAPTTDPVTTTTVVGDTATYRTFPVTVWTGDRYIVWGGELGSDALLANDGWIFDPATGDVEPIPPAPIAPRSGATGVFTVNLLIVCCGNSALGDDTDTAAAYDLSTGTWRTLADPPAGLTGRYAASVWHERCPHPEAECDPDRPPLDFVVVSSGWALPTEIANYDPRTDAWRSIDGAPGDVGTQPEIAWTGEELIVWSRTAGSDAADVGHRYDPVADTWSELPRLPAEDEITWGSITWTGEELVVWGLSVHEDAAGLRGRGFRWRPGAESWTPLSDPGLPPIDYYNGTPGSQAIVYVPGVDRVVLHPTHGYEFGIDPETGAPGPVPLLAWDPETDTWERLGDTDLGYAPQLTAGAGVVFRPDPTDPVVADLTRG